ncbi:zinc finger BED domain-containing protein 5-like [Octopus sinensis]|uniref:Zinc finger BED domain-containing protein 5-like n=1 Tax=Octopus sinensis TaxID=2607531 RepID=A0A6P7T1R3_9MOLL|nr:zinc finger BED domain-containing protein 5-like [Octopus sinensis]
MHGDKVVRNYAMIPLSNNTLKQQMEDMSDSVKNLIVKRMLKCESYSLQLDESKDISSCVALSTFIRYEFNGMISEDFLFYQSLPSHVTSESIFNSLDEFIIENEIRCSKCVQVNAFGVLVMSGKYSRYNTKCQMSTLLVARSMPRKLKMTLKEALKIVDFIRTHPLNSQSSFLIGRFIFKI